MSKAKPITQDDFFDAEAGLAASAAIVLPARPVARSVPVVLLPEGHGVVGRTVAFGDVADAALRFLDRIAEGSRAVRVEVVIDGGKLEQAARGAYTGSFGYINRDGDMDFNILIRTITQRGRDINLRSGAGIVADSDPQRELHETRAKAKGMLAALGWS